MQTERSPRLVIIACKIFHGLLEKHLPSQRAIDITYLDYGLHSVPRKLRTNVQEQLDALEEPSLVVMGYGLCGNGLHGIKSGRHTLLIPRADDCISILLGSYRSYREQFDSEPGTYYLSKGWLESGSNPLMEYERYKETYGDEKAVWLMDVQYRNYKRLVFVAHSLEDLESYRPQAKDVAEYCQRWGMRYEEILGSEDYVHQLFEVAVMIDQAGEDFIVVPPGGELSQDQFLR